MKSSALEIVLAISSSKIQWMRRVEVGKTNHSGPRRHEGRTGIWLRTSPSWPRVVNRTLLFTAPFCNYLGSFSTGSLQRWFRIGTTFCVLRCVIRACVHEEVCACVHTFVCVCAHAYVWCQGVSCLKQMDGWVLGSCKMSRRKEKQKFSKL